MSIDKLRRVCLFFIVVSVIFVTIAIFTDEWFVWKSKCMEFVRLTKGLWSECGNNQTLTLISWLNPECRFCQACPCQACAFTPEHFICGPLGIVQKLRWRAAPFPEPQGRSFQWVWNFPYHVTFVLKKSLFVYWKIIEFLAGWV